MKHKQTLPPLPDDMKYLQDTLYVISGKWKLPVLYSLAQGHNKFRDLQRSIPRITSKMLAKELRDLELNGFIIKKLENEFSNVHEYEVTQYCKTFETIIAAMIQWGKNHRTFLAHQKSMGQ